MSRDILDAEFLVRIEGILDALEVHGKNSTEFLTLCSELQTCVEMASGAKASLKKSGDVSDDLKDRLKQILGRIEKLEIYSTKQADITSNLQKHIADADK